MSMFDNVTTGHYCRRPAAHVGAQHGLSGVCVVSKMTSVEVGVRHYLRHFCAMQLRNAR